ncbi:MAG: hypothetical protein ACLP50_10015 [Solirubrobacteraceae bacterium]
MAPLDLRPEPELDATLAQIDDRSGHVVVSAAVLKDRDSVGQAEDVRYVLRIE